MPIGGVAESLRDDRQRHAVLAEQARVRIAQIM